MDEYAHLMIVIGLLLIGLLLLVFLYSCDSALFRLG
jgi:hypothetical protein